MSTRRKKTIYLAATVAALVLGVGAWLLLRSAHTFRAGRLTDYAQPGVYQQFRLSERVYVVRLPQGELIALSASCPHLGCTLDWLPTEQRFRDPCHDCRFSMSGMNVAGPAPVPLPRYRIILRGDRVVVDKSVEFRWERGEWSKLGSHVKG